LPVPCRLGHESIVLWVVIGVVAVGLTVLYIVMMIRARRKRRRKMEQEVGQAKPRAASVILPSTHISGMICMLNCTSCVCA
jgi:NADH:ubiquinone oxidoreductase subunit 6 (subunit J)